jgi:hypothetical protein
MPEALTFVKSNREALVQMPVATFVACATMQEDTEENRRTVAAYLDPLRELVEPVEEGLFADVAIKRSEDETDDRASQVRAGQVFERVALMATALNICVHPMSQILEIPELKTRTAALIPSPGVVPQHTFRLGYAEPEKDHTPRRPLADVLV